MGWRGVIVVALWLGHCCGGWVTRGLAWLGFRNGKFVAWLCLVLWHLDREVAVVADFACPDHVTIWILHFNGSAWGAFTSNGGRAIVFTSSGDSRWYRRLLLGRRGVIIVALWLGHCCRGWVTRRLAWLGFRNGKFVAWLCLVLWHLDREVAVVADFACPNHVAIWVLHFNGGAWSTLTSNGGRAIVFTGCGHVSWYRRFLLGWRGVIVVALWLGHCCGGWVTRGLAWLGFRNGKFVAWLGLVLWHLDREVAVIADFACPDHVTVRILHFNGGAWGAFTSNGGRAIVFTGCGHVGWHSRLFLRWRGVPAIILTWILGRIIATLRCGDRCGRWITRRLAWFGFRNG